MHSGFCALFYLGEFVFGCVYVAVVLRILSCCFCFLLLYFKYFTTTKS